MTWRRVVVAMLLALWAAIGVAWGRDGAIVFGFLLFIASATGLRVVRRNDRSLRWGREHYDDLLNGSRQR